MKKPIYKIEIFENDGTLKLCAYDPQRFDNAKDAEKCMSTFIYDTSGCGIQYGLQRLLEGLCNFQNSYEEQEANKEGRKWLHKILNNPSKGE